MSEEKKGKVEVVKDPEAAGEGRVDPTNGPAPVVDAMNGPSGMKEKGGEATKPYASMPGRPEETKVASFGKDPNAGKSEKKPTGKRQAGPKPEEKDAGSKSGPSSKGEKEKEVAVKPAEKPGKEPGEKAGDKTPAEPKKDEPAREMTAPQPKKDKEAETNESQGAQGRGSGKLVDQVPSHAYGGEAKDGDASVLEAVREIRNDLREMLLIMRENQHSGGARLG